MTSIEDYIKNTWEILPLYQFYELDIPFIKNKVAIYSTIALSEIEIKQDFISKYFIIYGVYPRISRCIGNVFVWRKNVISRVSAHSISACTDVATKKYIESSFRTNDYANEFLNLVSYGIEAEVITDLAKVLQVHLGENK